MNIFTKIRLRFGLLWKTNRPGFEQVSDFLTGLIVVAMILLTYGFLDANERATEEKISAEKATSNFAHFLNGGVITDQAQSFAVKCSQLLEVTN